MSNWLLKPEIAYAPYHDFSYSIGALTASQQHQYHNEGYITSANTLTEEDASPGFSAYVYRYYQTTTYEYEQRCASRSCGNACWGSAYAERIAELRGELGITPIKKITFEDDDWDTPLYNPESTGNISVVKVRQDTDINHMSISELEQFITSKLCCTSSYDKELVYKARERRKKLYREKERRVQNRDRVFRWLSDGPLNREEMKVLRSLCQGFVDWCDKQDALSEQERYRQSLFDELHLLEGFNK